MTDDVVRMIADNAPPTLEHLEIINSDISMEIQEYGQNKLGKTSQFLWVKDDLGNVYLVIFF